jgi:HNH endonuclease
MASSSTDHPIGTERKIFGAPGRCIYCGSTDGLTDEHILPYGLGGNYIFEKASCKRCAKITGAAEQRLMRGTMWPTRLKQNIQSRTAGPETMPLYLFDDGTEAERVDLKPDDFPEYMALLGFDPAGILVGATPTEVPMTYPCFYRGREFDDRMSKLGKRYLSIHAPSPLEICQVLAKIAHSLAMADCVGGAPTFQPLLPDLVLGRYTTPTYLVGCPTLQPPDPEPNIIHRANLQLTPDKSLLLCRIRLFENLRAPEYCVVVGRLISS